MYYTIKAHIYTGDDSGFVAECIELPIVTQGQTLDEVVKNLREAISLHLEGEDLVALGFTPDMPITVNYEMTIPPFPDSSQPVAWWREKQTLTPSFAGLIVVLLWLLALLGGLNIFESWQERGQFGDLFGSVNALFSGFAFVALIYTIHLQREELSLQRTELKLQREEMVASRGELAAQVAVQKSLHHATIGQIKVAAEQARIEVCKINPHAPGANISQERINKIANKIDDIANELENS